DPAPVSGIGGLAEWVLRLARSSGIRAYEDRPTIAGAGSDIVRDESSELCEAARASRSAGARDPGQPEAGRALDAGRRLASAETEALQGDHDESAWSAGGAQRAGSAVHGGGQRWVGDTTEFGIGDHGKLYLAAILDLFSRFVVGWALSGANDRH